MTRVLVTGAGGFVGRHCLPFLLERGDEVHAVVHEAVAATANVQAHRCNLLDDGAVNALLAAVRPSHLLHFAWYAVPGRFWTAPENHAWLAAGKHLIRAFAAHGGRRIVVAGSCAEYDWSHELLREADTPLVPRTLYGTAKNALRADLAAAAGGLGLDWAWGRLFFLSGPHEARGRLVSDVIAGLVAGERVPVSAGRQQRDFLHVEDVGRAFARLLDSAVSGPVNVASGETVAVREVVERIAALTGRPDLVEFGARPTAHDEPARLAADVDALRRDVGFTPRYALADGLAQTVAWWRDHEPRA